MPDNLSQPITPTPISNPAPIPPTPPTTVAPPVAPPLPTPPVISPPPVLKKEPKRIKTLLAILILFILSGSVPLAVLLTRQRQEVRKEAAGTNVSVSCTKGTAGPCQNNQDKFYGLLVVHKFESEAACRACESNQNDPTCQGAYLVGQLDVCGNRATCTPVGECTTNQSDGVHCVCGFSQNIPPCSVVQLDCLNNPYPGGGITQGTIAWNCAGPCVAPTNTPPAQPTSTPTPGLPGTCNSISVVPNPFMIGNAVTFTCNVTPGTGGNQVAGYAFNVQGVRYPAGDTWQASNVLTLSPTAGGSVWCGAKLQNGQIVGGQNSPCMTTLSVQPTPTPTATPIPSGTPRPTATPTQPSYSLSCTTCRVYDTNWNQISNLSSIQLNQTVYFATQGSTDHPQGITKAQFRINGGNWQETTNTHSGLFYIQFTVPSPGSYTVESMVYNPALGWY